MPEERDIEKKLRAAAAQRRADAGDKFALHPATRRVLQGEVARTRPQPRTAGTRSFWPRFAWGVSMLAVLAVGVWSLKTPNVAKQKIPVMPSPAAEPTSVNSASAPMAAEFKEALAAKESLPARRLDADASIVAKQSVAPASPPPAIVGAIGGERGANFDAVSVAPASAPVMAADKSFGGVRSVATPKSSVADFAAIKTDGLALTEQASPEIVPVQQNARLLYNFSNQSGNRSPTEDRAVFARTAAKKSFAQSADASVLNHFQFEQTGNTVRLVDSDGSVYTGALLADTREKEKEVAPKDLAKNPSSAAATAAGNVDSLAQNFRFTASGSNVSLRQRVLVNAEFFAVTSNTIPGLSQNWNNVSDQQLKSKLQNNLRAPGSRLVGRATTADGQAVELDAAETPAQLK
ncbi:MAG: hypothetical protein RLZZ350_331 [Verrucomicrobiota bacterium]|jgi:hypothetical protein